MRSRASFKTCLQMLLNDSGSMEPAFQRGDILFLNNQDSPIRVGEIVVFKIKDRDIPIVHRVMKVHEKEDGKVRNSFRFLPIFVLYSNTMTDPLRDCP